jgi:predicted ATPase
MHATELMRQLVDDGTIRYSEGLWVIPTDLASSGAPKTLADAMDLRVRGLSEEARRLGEVLAVAGGSPSLDLVADFADGAGEVVHESSGRLVDRTFAALDELTEKGVLQGDGERFRFRHDSAREALLRAIADDRRRAIHRTVGARLQLERDAEERAAEIGFHLLEGGDERGGSEMLARAGHALFDAQALADCIAPLEAALSCRERLGESRGRTMELRAMLLAAGWVSDRAVGSKHALRVVQEYRAQSGIATADRLRFLGRPVALVIGLGLATVAWIFRGSARGPSRCGVSSPSRPR